MKNLTIQSWNTQRELNHSGHTSLRKFKLYLKSISADIIILQEMRSAQKVFTDIKELESYNIFIPKINKSPLRRIPGYNYNVVLSKYPIVKTEEIIFPKWNKHRALENATMVDIKIKNKILRIYNCHFGVWKVGAENRLKQLKYILSDAKTHRGPKIICGDMNVTTPKKKWTKLIIKLLNREPKNESSIKEQLVKYDERELFHQTITKYGFKECLDLYTPTWSPFKSKKWEIFQLKLDWFMIKNIKLEKVHLDDYVSDHKSIIVNCKI